MKLRARADFTYCSLEAHRRDVDFPKRTFRRKSASSSRQNVDFDAWFHLATPWSQTNSRTPAPRIGIRCHAGHAAMASGPAMISGRDSSYVRPFQASVHVPAASTFRHQSHSRPYVSGRRKPSPYGITPSGVSYGVPLRRPTCRRSANRDRRVPALLRLMSLYVRKTPRRSQSWFRLSTRGVNELSSTAPTMPAIASSTPMAKRDNRIPCFARTRASVLRDPGPATYRPARACGSTARRRCCAAPCRPRNRAPRVRAAHRNRQP
jgi:hypothetical protein